MMKERAILIESCVDDEKLVFLLSFILLIIKCN